MYQDFYLDYDLYERKIVFYFNKYLFNLIYFSFCIDLKASHEMIDLVV